MSQMSSPTESAADEYDRRLAERRRSVLLWIRVGQVGWMLANVGSVVVIALARSEAIGTDITYPLVGIQILGGIAAGCTAAVGLWNRSLLTTSAALLAFGPWLVICVFASMVIFAQVL